MKYCLNNEVSNLLGHKIGSMPIGTSWNSCENKLQFGSLPFVTLRSIGCSHHSILKLVQ